MESIWTIQLTFRPAGPLTFRRMPSGSLPIMSYPFMPPTTMSGFLKRLLLIAEEEKGDWPGYGDDWFQKPKAGKEAPGAGFTLTLEKSLRCLGAFPHPERWSIHKTRRHGPKNFQHSQFSQLLREDHKENYQLHHWDYLFCDHLTGWVVAREREPLEKLKCLTNFGGKAGKEGFLYVSEARAPQPAEKREGNYVPLGLAPLPLRPESGAFYTLYGHHWSNDYLWTNGERGGVVGYFQLGAWWNAGIMDGPYWALEEGVGFPAIAPDAFLRGDVEKFAG
jgi:hypothetical protein